MLSKQKVNPGPKLVYMKSTSYTEIFVDLDQAILPLWPVASISNYRPYPIVCLCSSVSYYSNTSNNILRMFQFSEGKRIATKSLSHLTPAAQKWGDIKLFSTYRQNVNSQNVNRKSKLAFILPNFDGAKRIGPHN